MERERQFDRVAGRYGHYERGTQIPQTFAAGLDSIGRPLWIRGYRFAPEAAASKWASIRLADDGGAVISHNLAHSSVSNGSLWIMKARVNDGSVGFTSEFEETTDLPISNGDPDIRIDENAITVSDSAAKASPTQVTVIDPKLVIVPQTP